MHREDVDRLERLLEQAVGRVLEREQGEKPDPRIVHLMAKAAVTVLEAAEPRH